MPESCWKACLYLAGVKAVQYPGELPRCVWDLTLMIATTHC